MSNKSFHSPKTLFLSTDIEADGPIPGPNSMLSFGSAVFRLAPDTERGYEMVDTFEANLETLPGAQGDPDTMAWWKTQPAAWDACRKDPKPPDEAMPRYVQWLKDLPGRPVFVGYPVTFDFTFVYWYVMRFGVAPGQRCPFGFQGFDIKTLAAQMLDVPYPKAIKRRMPRRWFQGAPKHDHTALTDAIGQGILLMNMLNDRPS